MTEKLTYVYVVVDRSGSMGSIRRAAWSGINEVIGAIQSNAAAAGGTTIASVIQFDSPEYGPVEWLYDHVDAVSLQPIAEAAYAPRGSTALYVALKAVLVKGESQRTTDDTGFLVTVISDGEENASTEIDGKTIKAEIARLEATKKWTFAYMLANVKIGDVQRDLGAQLGSTRNFAATQIGTATASHAMADAVGTYMSSTRSSGQTSSDSFYDDAEAEREKRASQAAKDPKPLDAISRVIGRRDAKP